MKRITSFLFAMLLACATNLWADVATYKVTSTSEVTPSGEIPEGASATYKSTYSSAYQLTKDNSMTLTLKGYEGYVITGITLSMKSNSKAGAGTFSAKAGKTTLAEISTATTFNKWFDNASYTTTYTDVHVTMANAAYTIQTGEDVVIVIAATANSLYCSSFTITYAKPAAVPTPIFYAYDNVDDVENNGFYTSDLMVEIECDDYDAVIRYTTDGTEPTAESDEYDGNGLFFANEFVTLRAKAFKGEDASYEATANYYHNSSLEVPYTTTQAVALYNALGDVEEVFVEGSVDGNPTYYESSSSSNYNITDGTISLYMYSGKAGDGCGLADIAKLVQGDKVVVKGKLTAYKGATQLGAGNTIVKWTENTNPVLICAESVAFGNISTLVGTVPSKTLEVTAKNLTKDITVTLSDGAAFTLSTTTLPAEGGSIEITPVLTVGENIATLTLTSGEKSATVTLTATIQQAYTISWSVNGNVTSTSAVIEGENLVLPASPEAPYDCASKVFVGWATTATVAADGTGIVFVNASTTATADATYYAVFATATESTSATASVTFSDMFSGKTTNGSKDIDGEALDITDGITVTFAKSSSSISKAQYYDSGAAVRLYAGGSITLNSTATITSFTLTFGGSDGTNTFTADCGTWKSPTWTGEAKTIVLTEGGTSGNRRIAGISVSYKQTAWEDYATTCDDTPSAISSATVEIPAVKTIENGQLVIIRDGVKYNAMGVRLQ